MAGKNYKREELKRLVDEFTTEFESLVKSEVAKTGQALQKSEDGDKKESKEESSGGDSGSSGSDKGPPSGGDSSGGDASAGGLPADAGSAPAGGPPAPGGDPASAGGVPPADPAAGASAGDPVQALTQAYAQLSPEELQSHFFALQQVLQAQMGGGAGAPPAGPPGADPMAASAGAPPPGAGAPPAPGGAGPAPMAGEGSKPVDPMASMAMKSMKDELDLVKSERDALKKSLTGMAETLEKLASRPQYKAAQATDHAVLIKNEQPNTKTMTAAEIRRKLTVVAQNTDLKKSDRVLINKYCVGGVEVDAIAHLLA